MCGSASTDQQGRALREQVLTKTPFNIYATRTREHKMHISILHTQTVEGEVVPAQIAGHYLVK